MLGLGSNKFDPNEDIPDLSGKVFVVTGGSAGIGYGICAHLLQHNCEKLYLLGKKEEHLQEAGEGLKAYGDTSRVTLMQIELEDLHQTDQVAKQLASELTQIDALVLNAGLGVGVYNETKDGIDSHMQVNVFAQHHLMMMLLPTLLKTPDSRVVYQSSEFHRLGTGDMPFKDLAEINQDIGASKLYARTKLAQVLLARSLARHKTEGKLEMHSGKEPWFVAVHPGGVNTDQPAQAEEAYGKMGKIGVKAVKPFMKSPTEEGCRPALFAATSPEVIKEKLDGVYVVPDRKVTDVAKHAHEEQLQEQCLKLTETTLAEKLGKLPYPTIYT